ncbi:alpha/beta hydrolase [Kitasatospora sp. NBC_01287]|uniref:alpha/beta fold hydrolase n=1 Tax=Kitasatospora sp. NBC_01287 TaxID=2903573 RepID=UPI00225590E8|nr:alpha/beta fold hydrolase [Kitasatospora sp. NBC_01287]MCX4745652.1 alpha/beta hydrolase [Kitasatospora sp. NBC_01287]
MDFTLGDGTRIDYDDHGTGPLAVYAHGALLSRKAEDEMGTLDWEAVENLPGRRFVRFDARSHGASAGRPVPEDHRFERFAEDLVEFLGHLGGARPVTGMGSSLGCATVLHAAVGDPALFDRLVLVIPPTAWETRPAQAGNYRLAAELVTEHGVDAFTTAMSAAPVPATLSGFSYPPSELAVRPELLPALLQGLAASDLPAREKLRELAQPTLILALADDPAHPRSTAEQLADLLPDAELHVADDSAAVRTWGDRVARFLA